MAVSKDTGESLEERARQARYSVFEEIVEADDVLLLGHHLDDQVETLMLRLLRGSGSQGLAAMPGSRALGLGRCRGDHYCGNHLGGNSDQPRPRRQARNAVCPESSGRISFFILGSGQPCCLA